MTRLTTAGSKHYKYVSGLGRRGFIQYQQKEWAAGDAQTPVTYLVRRGDDVHTHNLLRQDGLRVDAVEASSEFGILREGLNKKKYIYNNINNNKLLEKKDFNP